MSIDDIVRVLPFVVALVSLLVTAGLGYANYRLARDRTQMDREKFSHDRAMVFWDKKVEAYSRTWSSVTEAVEEYTNLHDVAADPREALRKWVVIKRINEKAADDDAGFLEMERLTVADPVGWLPWLLSERRVNFDELESNIRKDHFYITPEHRALIAEIFGACTGLRGYASLDEFHSTYEAGLKTVSTAHTQLKIEIDKTFYR